MKKLEYQRYLFIRVFLSKNKVDRIDRTNDKACRWAESHREDSLFHFVGVQHIHSLDDNKRVDGAEIGGGFFDDENVWERKDELIPEKGKIPAIMWEQNLDVPVGELMSAKQKRDIKEIFGED
jgi:hypothetical protein